MEEAGRMRVHTSVETASIPFAVAFRLLALVALLAWPGHPTLAETTFPESPLAIVTSDARHAFTVEVARSHEQRARGLMFRSQLDADRGMLFDFGREAEVNMWMRNTLLPLDMLFIDGAGVIRKIEANTKPLSLDTISSEQPVTAVLELNAGAAKVFGVEEGDVVVHPIFGNAADSSQ
jgi:uncharacterized membrane protein (UPF0127 family)